jgi:hypothetical protein
MAAAKPGFGEEIITLTKGSHYRVVSRGSGPEPIVTVGVFRGYTQFGNDSALSMELESEKDGPSPMVRILPCLTVLAIDVLSFKPEDKEKEKKKEADGYIG